MRIGVSSSGRWWVSMGPLGWLLYAVFVLPLLLAAWLIWAALTLAAAAWKAGAAMYRQHQARNSLQTGESSCGST